MNRSGLRNTRGFTMIEVILTVVLLATVAFLVIPNIPAVKRWGEDKHMVQQAQRINQAITDWRSDRPMRQAIQAWTGKDAAARYALIQPYIQYAPENLSGLLTEGFTLTFPEDPRNSVTLTDPDGNGMALQ